MAFGKTNTAQGTFTTYNKPAPKAPWTPGTDLNSLRTQRLNLRRQIQGGDSRPSLQSRLQQVRSGIKGLNHPVPTPTIEAPTAPVEAPVDTTTQPTGTPQGPEDTSGTTDALFPSMRSMEPANYEGSPLFQWQSEQGNKSLNKILAKRGLLNSGAEIQAHSDFDRALAGEEADKARGYAQNEADRLERIQQNEAGRQERRGQQASNDLFRWTQLGLDQNPANANFGGTDKFAGASNKYNQAITDFLKNNYGRVSGSGGGGASYNPGYFPGSPNFSAIDTLGTLGKGSNSNNIFSSFIRELPGLFGK